MSISESVHNRESAFHDEWASATPVGQIRVRELFESAVAMENAYILDRMGPLTGRRLLDLGTGLGEAAVYFAMCGATVTCSDLSAGMVQKALDLAAFHGVKIEGQVAPGEKLPFADGSFDIVYSANTLHHVTDRDMFFREISRILRPGGRFFTWDPLTYNPAINIYRRLATQVRTEDEKPIGTADLVLARKYFSGVQHHEFWLLALALFFKYYLWDRINPNEKRYWKLIYEENDRSLWWWKPLAAMDRVLCSIPLLRWWSWNTVLEGSKNN